MESTQYFLVYIIEMKMYSHAGTLKNIQCTGQVYMYIIDAVWNTIRVEKVVSWLVCSVPDWAFPSQRPGQGHFEVFLGKTLYFNNASLQPSA